MKKNLIISGSAIATALIATTTVEAETLFNTSDLGTGADIRAEMATRSVDMGSLDIKCGEGKCGEGKCGEGDKKGKSDMKKKGKEGKCGEGKCGEGDKKGKSDMKKKGKEGKCGEGKCGEGKCGA